MTEISRFFGIVIAMYHRDHEPADFHARYAGKKGTVRIQDGHIEGDFPPRVRALLLEWWDLTSGRTRRELAVSKRAGRAQFRSAVGVRNAG